MNTISRRTFLKILTITSAYFSMPKCSSIIEPLTIASHEWCGYQLMFLAQREGWLSTDNVKFLKTLSATDSIQALADNKVHGAALTLDEVLRARAKNIPLTCVLVFDISAGADMVLSKTEIKDLSHLKGKRIGVETSAVGSLMLYKLLEFAKLNKTDITPIELTFDQHINTWSQNKIDILITFQPIAYQLLNRGAYKIFDSRRIPNTIFDVLAIKSNLLEKYDHHIKNLITAHFHARQYFYQNFQDALYKMADCMNISALDVSNSFRGVDLPSEQTNLQYLSQNQEDLLLAAHNLSILMVDIKTLKERDSLENLFTADFLPKGL